MSRDDGKQRPVSNEIYKFSTRIFRLSEHGPGQRKSNDRPSLTWPSLTTTGAVLVDPTQLAFPFQLWSSLLLNVHVHPRVFFAPKNGKTQGPFLKKTQFFSQNSKKFQKLKNTKNQTLPMSLNLVLRARIWSFSALETPVKDFICKKSLFSIKNSLKI